MWIKVSGKLINLDQITDISIGEDAVEFTRSGLTVRLYFTKAEEVAALTAFFASRQNLSSNFLVDVTALFGPNARLYRLDKDAPVQAGTFSDGCLGSVSALRR